MTVIPVPAGADPAAAEYFARLQALRVGADEGWYDIVGADLNRKARYWMDLPVGDDQVRRVEVDQDVLWWVLGVGDAHGHGDLVLHEPVVPELVDLEQASDLLGISVDGVRHRVKTGRLHMVFPGGLRRLVRAEVLTDNPSVPAAAAESAAREWRNLNDAVCWQPPRVRDVTDGIRPASRPPLIAAGISVPERRALALTTASEAGLIRYLWMRPDAGTFGVSVTVGGDTVVRTLHGSTVTAWIRGVADGAGRPDVLEGIV